MVPLEKVPLPEGVLSLLDIDLYKLTMQCYILKNFTNVPVTYTIKTPDMKFSRASMLWLQAQIDKLGNMSMSSEELEYLRHNCRNLDESYVKYLETFKLRPPQQVQLSFNPISNTGSDSDLGDIDLQISGPSVETILYHTFLPALISECYSRFMDTDWSYEGKFERAKEEGRHLLSTGCVFYESGGSRRRDYHMQDLVLQGLKAASNAADPSWTGKFTGTSNVHFAMKHDLTPVGTLARERFVDIKSPEIIISDTPNLNSDLKYKAANFQSTLFVDTFLTNDSARKSNGKKSVPKPRCEEDESRQQSAGSAIQNPAGYGPDDKPRQDLSGNHEKIPTVLHNPHNWFKSKTKEHGGKEKHGAKRPPGGGSKEGADS